MDQTSDSNTKSWKRQLLIAKLLLRNYGILHEFHIRQLECYLVACCKTALDGTVEIDADNKSVSYQIYTSGYWKRNKEKKLSPRNKWSIKLNMLTSKKKYLDEVALATINLNTWTRELLWGDDTKIKVMIDGRHVEQKSN